MKSYSVLERCRGVAIGLTSCTNPYDPLSEPWEGFARCGCRGRDRSRSGWWPRRGDGRPGRRALGAVGGLLPPPRRTATIRRHIMRLWLLPVLPILTLGGNSDEIGGCTRVAVTAVMLGLSSCGVSSATSRDCICAYRRPL